MSRLLAFRRFLLFTGRRVVVTTASVVHSGVGTHPPPPPSSLHTLGRPHSPDQHVGSPRGDAQEPSRPLHSMPAVSRIIEASDFQALRSSSAHVSIPRNDGGSHAEADRRGRIISTGSCSRRRDFFVLRATRIPGIAASLVPQDSTSWKCSGGQMHSAYYCEQKRGFASGESNKALSVKDDIDEERISVTFVDRDGDEKVIQVPIDMSMLEAAHENDIELEGACEGSLACSTCHVIVMDEEYYEKIPEPSDEENDMLDLAFGLTEMSRLGCQVVAKPELDGMRLALPSATRNFAVDGHVPKPH